MCSRGTISPVGRVWPQKATGKESTPHPGKAREARLNDATSKCHIAYLDVVDADKL